MMNNDKETFREKNKKVFFTAFIGTVALILIFNLFDGLLVKIWRTLVVNPILIPSDITSKELAIKWIFVLTPVLLTFKGDYQPPKWIIRTVLIMSVAYVYFTIWYKPTQGSFYSFQEEQYSHIKYTDFFFLFTAMALFWGYREWISKRKKPLENKSIFSLEQLAEDNQYSDDHKRKDKAQLIAKQILLIEYKQAFGIGIVGSWGSGKTYFISMITQYIREKAGDSTNIIQFTPWVNTETRSITELFLEKLSNEIEGEASKKVKEYSKKIFETSSGVFSNISSIQFSSDTEISTEAINTAIVKSGKKIIVVIDDIDRLNENEVIEVFRLIRNTANFSNTIYLVAYDRVYVDDILRKVSEDKNSEYINKIIQFEYYLPQPKPQKLKDIFEQLFVDAVKRQFSQNDANRLIEKLRETLPLLPVSSNTNKNSTVIYFDDLITNTRDVHKIVNAFLFSLLTENEKAEIINWEDLFWLESIKLRSPFAYENIRTKQWLSSNKHHSRKGYFYNLSLLDSDEELNKDKNVGKAIKILFGHGTQKNGVNDIEYFDWYFESYSEILLPKEREMITSGNPDEYLILVFNILLESKTDALVKLVEDTTINEVPFRKLLISIALLRKGNIKAETAKHWDNLVNDTQYNSDESAYFYSEFTNSEDQEIINLDTLLNLGLKTKVNIWAEDSESSPSKRLITNEDLRMVLFKNALNSTKISIEDKWKLYITVNEEKGNLLHDKKGIYYKQIQLFKEQIIKYGTSEFIQNNLFLFEEIAGSIDRLKGIIFNIELQRFDKMRVCKINQAAMLLFENNTLEIEALIHKQARSFIKERLIFLFEKLKQYKFESVKCDSDFITYSSTPNLLNRIQRKADKVYLQTAAFEHHVFSNKRNMPGHPGLFFEEAVCVTQRDEMSNEEARRGGEYIYEFDFNLDDIEYLQSVNLFGFVDDECYITINGINYDKPHNGFFIITGIEHYFKRGKNNLNMQVVNYDGIKINDPQATWESNPYALRFLLVMTPK